MCRAVGLQALARAGVFASSLAQTMALHPRQRDIIFVFPIAIYNGGVPTFDDITLQRDSGQ
jgi:hypothetical protein